MWVLMQHNKDNSKFKYVVSNNYNDIISYINRLRDVKKINDYLFITSDEEIMFNIYLGEELDYEKKTKESCFNKQISNKKNNKEFRKNYKKISK